jgi:polysaccharide deacetylase family protein (PEP-CTERM system associated)
MTAQGQGRVDADVGRGTPAHETFSAADPMQNSVDVTRPHARWNETAPGPEAVSGDDAILNAFTVDVEDYYHVQAFADRIDPRRWDDYESRVVANTHRILKILDDYRIRGTFFILGWVADRHPHLVRQIQQSGHEIGCHGFWHRLIYEMSPEEFRQDLLSGAKAVEAITAQRVVAFRAPSFSITEKSLWALDILIEEGFQYDSSIFPVHHDNYGIPNAERFPHRIHNNGKGLWEFPPSVHRFWKINVPIAGGGYFRLYPARLSIRWLGRINRVERQPFLFYIHPWELDPDQPRLPGSLRSRFRHYQNLRRTEKKLRRLLETFRFGTLTQALNGDGICGQPVSPPSISPHV